MGLKQTISINELDGKSYQIRLVDGNEDKAVLTHYLHNYRNGVKKHYEKETHHFFTLAFILLGQFDPKQIENYTKLVA